MTDLPVLEKRRLQAEAIGPIFAEMEARLGRAQAEDILRASIARAAVEEGARFRARVPEGADVMEAFIALYELWTRGGALEIEVLEASAERYDFDVTRCRYAEMYREMGLGHIGHLLSCNRDGTFCQGFDPGLRLDRGQTIMQGAPRCTFRYRLERRAEDAPTG
jgi:hypothetical protein